MKHQDGFHDELLSGYLDGELTAEEQGLVEQALAENAELRHTFEELRALRGTLQSLPRYALGDDFTQQVLERAAASNAGTAGVTRAPASRASSWRGFALVTGAGLAALVLLGLFIAAQRTGAPRMAEHRPAAAPVEATSVAAPAANAAAQSRPTNSAPVNAAEPAVAAQTTHVPLVNIAESPSATTLVSSAPSHVNPPVAVGRVEPPAHTAAMAALSAHQGELLVLEVDATPAANHALALAGAMAASKIRLESPLRAGPSGAEGEGVANNTAQPVAPAKVEYFVVEGEPANVEALVRALRAKQQAFSRVEDPATLADAIERLAVLDSLGRDPLAPPAAAGAVSVSAPAPSVAANVTANATPSAPPATAALPQARAYRVASPAAILGSEKNDGANPHSVRVLVIVQNSGAAATVPETPATPE